MLGKWLSSGSSSMPSANLLLGISTLKMTAKNFDFFEPYSWLQIPLGFADFRKQKSAKKDMSLLSLIQMWHRNEATEPRDRIYALLSLATDEEILEPDYSKEKDAVFAEFSKQCVLQLSTLNILCATGFHEDRTLPSWIPDESYFEHSPRPSHLCDMDPDLSFSHATSGNIPQMNIISQLVLEAPGWFIGTVEDTAMAASSDSPVFNYMLVLEDWEQVMYRKFGDAGSCTEDRCSSQYYDTDGRSDYAFKRCEMSVSCVLDHWERRTSTAAKSLSETSGDKTYLTAKRTSIDQPRKWRRAKSRSAKTKFWNDDNYWPSETGIGEAFCRTILADKIDSWYGKARLDTIIEDSRLRKNVDFKLVPDKVASYPSFISAFCDSFIPRWNRAEDLRTDHAIECDICQREENRQTHAVFNHLLICQSLESATRHRRLMVAKSGLIGLAPERVKPGDYLALLQGCKISMVLRKHRGNYILIGECYIHGIMDGYFYKNTEKLNKWTRSFRII